MQVHFASYSLEIYKFGYKQDIIERSAFLFIDIKYKINLSLFSIYVTFYYFVLINKRIFLFKLSALIVLWNSLK